MPGAEGLFQRGIQYMHSHGKKRLNGEPVPAHLLLLDHSFCDDLIDCGFDLCLAKTPSDEKLNRSPDVLTVKSRLDSPDSC